MSIYTGPDGNRETRGESDRIMGDKTGFELLLVYPAMKRGHGAMEHEVGKLSSAPVALPYLASFVPPEFHVSIVDENADEIGFDKRVDLVGTSVLTMTAPRAYEISDLSKP